MSSYPWCSKKWLRDPVIPEGQFFHSLCALICIFGIVANSLIIAVMRREKLRNTAISFILISLAVFDTLKLITGLFMVADGSILPVFEKTHTLWTSNWSCASFMFVQKTVTTTAIWLVFAVLLERFLWVSFRDRTPLTKAKAKMLVGLIFLVNVLADVDYLITTKYNDKKTKCSSRDFFEEYCIYRTEFKGIAEAVWKLIPLLLNIIFTGIIVRKNCQDKRRGKRDSDTQPLDGTMDESNRQLVMMALTVVIVSSIVLLPPNINSAYGKFTERSTCAKGGKDKSTAPTLIPSIMDANETYFLSMNGFSFSGDFPKPSASRMSPKECAYSVFLTYIAGRPFFLLNHAINFFVFIVCSSFFRHEFYRMLSDCCSFCSNGSGSSSNNNRKKELDRTNTPTDLQEASKTLIGGEDGRSASSLE